MDKAPKVAQVYGVTSMPSFKIIKDSKEVYIYMKKIYKNHKKKLDRLYEQSSFSLLFLLFFYSHVTLFLSRSTPVEFSLFLLCFFSFSFFFFYSFSLSLSQTRTHMHTHTHTHALSLSLSLSHTHTHTLSLSLCLTHCLSTSLLLEPLISFKTHTKTSSK